MIGARYKYTLEEFYEKLTLRQIHYLLRVVDKKRYEDLEVRAKLAGAKMKPRNEPLRLKKEERDEYDKHAQDALARLQKRYKSGEFQRGRRRTSNQDTRIG